MKDKRGDEWYPKYVDKWLFGSTRHELIIRDKDGKFVEDLRGIWEDLLALSKKDHGFIRANPTTPYPIPQLAGMFYVPEEKVRQVIEICLREDVKKLQETSPGIYYVLSTEQYELSKRHERRLRSREPDLFKEPDTMAGNPDTMAAEPVPRGEKRRGEENRGEKKEKDSVAADFSLEFSRLWHEWPKKIHKDDAFDAYRALRRKGIDSERIWMAMVGYSAYLKTKSVKEKFDQAVMNLATFLRKNRWQDYEGETYRAPL